MLQHALADHLLFVGIALVTPLADRFWFYPRLIADSAAGVPGARTRFYRIGILWQWALVILIAVVWLRAARGWEPLRLVPHSPVGLVAGLALAALFCWLLIAQRRVLLARPERLRAVRARLTAAEPLLPHTQDELRMFRWLSITAGICEEFIFRAYLVWYLAIWMGPWGAALCSTILFGFAHVYLDGRQAVRAGAFGAVLMALVMATGVLWPAVIMHAAMDLSSGDLGFHALSLPEPVATVTTPSGGA
jgi:membrane protease YdiL (CAAX protease family)